MGNNSIFNKTLKSMQYKTEFQLSPDELRANDVTRRIEFMKKRNAGELGRIIETVVPFEEEDLHGDTRRFKLELQAFSQKDWMEFKRGIAKYILNNFPADRAKYEWLQFQSMFKEVENIGIEKSMIHSEK